MKTIETKNTGRDIRSIVYANGAYYVEIKFGPFTRYAGKTEGLFSKNGYKSESALRENSRYWNQQ